MDTRDKIITAEAAVEIACGLKRAGQRLAVATGYFDVVLAAHVRDLENVRRSAGADVLLVVLLPMADSLLAERARAEMAAALSMIDYVVTAGEGGVEELLNRLAADQVVERQAADEQEKRLLIEHVHSRHSL